MWLHSYTQQQQIFYYGKGMQSKYISSTNSFVDYVGRNCGESERQSIEANRLIIVDIEEPEEIQTKEEYDKLSFKDQKMWDKRMDVWFKTESIVNKNLSYRHDLSGRAWDFQAGAHLSRRQGEALSRHS